MKVYPRSPTRFPLASNTIVHTTPPITTAGISERGRTWGEGAKRGEVERHEGLIICVNRHSYHPHSLWCEAPCLDASPESSRGLTRHHIDGRRCVRPGATAMQ